jgi:hypothetical protein
MYQCRRHKIDNEIHLHVSADNIRRLLNLKCARDTTRVNVAVSSNRTYRNSSLRTACVAAMGSYNSAVAY